ncbi:class I adenylate-forming enzyme family protein [Cytobacillus praedii]|uniref:class I adenylate-forming enzyme family protein n=2 Tax=Cytobacillus praedii TaxID=1742358 RepID=UPI003AF4AB40
MNIWSFLQEPFTEYSDLCAVSDSTGKTLMNYDELKDRVHFRANEISSKTALGDKVIVICNNSHFDAINILAVIAAGRVVIITDLKYGEQRCQDIAKATRPQLIISEKDIYGELEKYDQLQKLDMEQDRYLPSSVVPQEQSINNDRPAVILFTSGTNGLPKGVVLTHRNIISNLESIKDSFPFDSAERTAIVRSLSHASAFTGELLYSLWCGASIVFYNGSFFPAKLVHFLVKTKATFLGTTPTIFNYIYNYLKHDSHNLKKVVLSGECLLQSAATAFYTSLPNIEFYNAYGLTEASPRVSYLEPKDFNTRPGSVGKPIQGVSVKIVNDEGEELKAEEVGEIIISGPNVLLEYWNDKSLTAMRLNDNYLNTRDLGYFDSHGFLYVIGRKDNMIIRAGVNIYPSEIEAVLLKHPSINEVLIWGEPDSKYGQIICAEIVPSDENVTEKTIINICRESLPSYLWIDRLKIVNELTYNINGKKIVSANN